MSATRRKANRAGSRDRRARDDEALEIVVIVRGLEIVARWAPRDVVLGSGFKAEQRRSAADAPCAASTQATPGRSRFCERAPGRRKRALGDEVGLVEDGEIGRHELIAEHFLDRVVMRGKARAGRRLERGRSRARRASITAMTPSTVTRALISGQCEAPATAASARRGPRSRRRHGRAGCGALEKPRQSRQKILGDGAADAAVRELDDLVVGAGVAAGEQQLAVDAELAELVDEEADAAARRVGEKMAHEARLAGAQKPRDDGDRELAHQRAPSLRP